MREAAWLSEKDDLQVQIAGAKDRASSMEEDHRRDLAQLSDQIKATLKRERDDKRRLHFENAQLQAKLQELSRQLEADF